MRRSKEDYIFNTFAFLVTTLFALTCLLPILYTISGSFTQESELLHGLKLLPSHWTTDAYQMVFRNSKGLIRAYGVTIALVALGTFLGLFLMTMTAYVLYRRDFRARNILSFYFFFTTLFSGGLVPQYILVCALGLRNTFGALLVTGLFSVFNLIIIRSYLTSNIPQSLVESAKIDGANDFRIYLSIVLPSSGPILATVGLLVAIGYWNNWSAAAIYISDTKLYPLQYFLYRIFQESEMAQQMAEAGLQLNSSTPSESYKLAMTVFTMGPVVLFYPFVQKYFVSGVTVGAVKE